MIDREFLDRAILAIASNNLQPTAVIARAVELAQARQARLEELDREDAERARLEEERRDEERKTEARTRLRGAKVGDYYNPNTGRFVDDEVLAEMGLAVYGCTLVPKAELEALQKAQPTKRDPFEDFQERVSARQKQDAAKDLETFRKALAELTPKADRVMGCDWCGKPIALVGDPVPAPGTRCDDCRDAR